MHTSTSTVSLVLNHRYDKRVRPDLARDILRTAEEMGYHYNELAASLRKGATHTIAFISDIKSPLRRTPVKSFTERKMPHASSAT